MKYKVIYDIDDFHLKKNEGGMYAILPYERIDDKGKAMFKVGLADNYGKRFESYHTDYPAGFYYANLLASPTLEKKDFEIKGGRVSPEEREKRKKTAQSKYYRHIEKQIFSDIQKNGGKRYKTTTRVKGADEEGRGDSEWFYTNEKTIDTAFSNAYKVFGGKKLDNNLNNVNKEANKNRRGATYTAEIHYKVF